MSRGVGLGLHPGLPLVTRLQDRWQGMGDGWEEKGKTSQSAQCMRSGEGLALGRTCRSGTLTLGL